MGTGDNLPLKVVQLPLNSPKMWIYSFYNVFIFSQSDTCGFCPLFWIMLWNNKVVVQHANKYKWLGVMNCTTHFSHVGVRRYNKQLL